MRGASLFPLLPLLHLASAAPIPILTPSNCEEYSACRPALRFVSKITPPPTTFTTPHFPSRQRVADSRTGGIPDEAVDDIPVNPPSALSPSAALSADAPLSTTLLLSLSKSQTDDFEGKGAQDALWHPAMPTNTPPELRKADTIRYLKSLSQSGIESEDELPRTEGAIRLCQEVVDVQGATHLRLGRPKVRRNYGEFMVVGIVVAFLLVVIVLEFFQSRKRSNSSNPQQGAIFLENEKAHFTQYSARPKLKVCTRGYSDDGVMYATV